MNTTREMEQTKRIAEKNALVEKQVQDKPYTVMLIVLGIACIIFATIMTIDRGLNISKEGGTLYIIGGVLVFGAYIWQQQDIKNIAKIDKKIDDVDGDAYQEERIQ